MRILTGSALLATVWLLFNMVAVSVWWGGANPRGGALWWVQAAAPVGFVYMVLFDLASALWILARSCWRRTGDQEACEAGWLLVLALFALMGLMGAKAMVDEIAREHGLGGGLQGEWVVLYACLTVQLAYGIAILSRGRVRGAGGKRSP
jgi:hypothetical protein